jgi:hypothetical protein
MSPEQKSAFPRRSVGTSNEAVAEPTPQEKAMVKLLLDHLTSNYGFWQQVEHNDNRN